MRPSKWLALALLLWGLFTGIAYATAPLVTDRWGNDLSTLAGIALILLCGAGLLRLDLRRR